MIAPMTAAAADWIYNAVLTATYRRSVGAEAGNEDAGHVTGPAVLRMCPCQWGTCHGCLTGHHDYCARRRIGSPAAHVIRTAGDVAVVPIDARTSVFASVWLAGRQCGWRCACGCVAAPAQLDLFDLAGGGR